MSVTLPMIHKPRFNSTSNLTCAAGDFQTNPAIGAGLAFGNVRYDSTTTSPVVISTTTANPVTITSLGITPIRRRRT